MKVFQIYTTIKCDILVNYNAEENAPNGTSCGNGTIDINYRFVSEPTKNYSIDKVIDTLTHETRHQYQRDAWNNPPKYGLPEGLRQEWDNSRYVESTGIYEDYYRQEVERDARGFAAVSKPSS